MVVTTPDPAAPKKIGTHNGAFHCDEVLAVYMLRQTTQFSGAEVVRTRDAAVLANMDIVVDVGGEFNSATNRFDHHQKGFEETFASSGPRSSIKLSSAGLIYRHFGREVVSTLLQKHGISLTETEVETVFLHVYDSFMEAIDGIDNGVTRYISDSPARYRSNTDLSSRVGRLNPEWYVPKEEQDQDKSFELAVKLVGPEFDDAVFHAAKSWLPARALVEKAMNARFDDFASGEIMVLRDWAPWKSHLYDIEKEAEEQGAGEDKKKILYVVYEDVTGASWRVQCVPKEPGSFESRRPLPKQWRGIRDAALTEESGIPECVFVHASGFIGGNKTFEGAFSMAKKSLELTQA